MSRRKRGPVSLKEHSVGRLSAIIWEKLNDIEITAEEATPMEEERHQFEIRVDPPQILIAVSIRTTTKRAIAVTGTTIGFVWFLLQVLGPIVLPLLSSTNSLGP
jgi:hypothetical protein